MGILHPQSGLFADVTILLFVHILLHFHFPSSTAKVISVPGDITFTVKLGRDSPQTIRDWIENGANTRIKVKVQYSHEFGFPPEANCENGMKLETTEKDNNDTTGPKSKSALSPEAALNYNVEYARTIFDWCRWEWSFKGRRGIWDTDFRFETYSLGLVILADTKIDVLVEFDRDRTPQQKRRYFKECLNHREQLQEIARAIKWALDDFVEKEEEAEESSSKTIPTPDPENHTDINSVKSLCKVPLRSNNQNFKSGLKDDSHLCFRALRPERAVRYLNAENLKSKQFYLADVCIFGNEELEDARRFHSINNKDDKNNKDDYPNVTIGFFDAIRIFQILFSIFVIVNLPLLAFKLYPESTELKDNCSHDVNPVLEEKEELKRNSSHLMSRFESVISEVSKDSIRGDPRQPRVSLSQVVEEEIEMSSEVYDANMTTIIGESSPMVNGASATTGTKNEEQRTKDEVYIFTPLDAHTPSQNVFGIFSLSITCFPAPVNDFLSCLRRFVLFVLFSTHIIIFAAILDHCRERSRETITRLLAFKDYQYQKYENQVDLTDLRFWNKLVNSDWNNVYGILLPLWLFCLMWFSQTSFIKECMKQMRPRKFFGACDIISLWPESFINMDDGLKKIARGLELRMGLFYRIPFWKILWNSVSDPNSPKTTRVKNFFINFLSFLTFFPICAPLIPLCCNFNRMMVYLQNRKWKKALKKCAFLIFLIIFLILAGFSVYQSVYIYSMFVVFTLTSTIYHYQQSLNVLGVIAGSVTFILKIRSQVRNQYISLKMLTVEVATAIHESKLEEAGKRLRESTSFNAGPPQLIWYASNGIPYIPFRLYQSVIKELKPVGPERAKIVVKLAIMAVFVVYIHTVMRTLRMNEDDAAFDVAQAALTVVAVVIPSLLANLQSEVEKELEKERNKCVIKKMIEKFLEENDKFYQFTIQ